MSVVRHLLTNLNTLQSARGSRGFTVVELIIVIGVSGIILGLIFGPLSDLYTANNNGLQKTIARTDNHSALQSIRQAAVASLAFNSSNSSVSDPDPAKGSSWAGGSDVLITSNYATTVNGSGVRTLLQGGAGCSPLVNHYIFFVDGGTLYRRTLTMQGVVSPCLGATWEQRQTCATATSFPRCRSSDAKLLTGVESFKVDYYTLSSSNIATSPNAAKSIQVEIKQKSGSGSDLVTGKIRINRTNGS